MSDRIQRYPYLDQSDVAKRYQGVRAFKEVSDSAAQVQAAMVLVTSLQLSGIDPMPAVPMRGKAVTAAVRTRVARSQDEVATLGAPAVKRVRKQFAAGRVEQGVMKMHRARAQRFGGRARAVAPAELVNDLGQKLFQSHDPQVAAQLFRACLDHPQPIVQIAGALAYARHVRASATAIGIMVRYLNDADPSVAELAAASLAAIRPRHPKLVALTRGKRRIVPTPPTRTTVLVHGTWAKKQPWWQPGGDFYDYLNGIRRDVYGAEDRFLWTGAYSDAARALAGRELAAWIAAGAHDGLDLMGHSHGGNVSMLATQRGAKLGQLVLLSTPVHWAKYQPNFALISEGVVSIRAKMDMVILVDGGGLTFPHEDIREIVLPIWFQHGASHDPDAWKKHNVHAKL